MTLLWLLIWWVQDTPIVDLDINNLNDWAVALFICVALDIAS